MYMQSCWASLMFLYKKFSILYFNHRCPIILLFTNYYKSIAPRQQVLAMKLVKFFIGKLILPALKCYHVINQHNVLKKESASITCVGNLSL